MLPPYIKKGTIKNIWQERVYEAVILEYYLLKNTFLHLKSPRRESTNLQAVPVTRRHTGWLPPITQCAPGLGYVAEEIQNYHHTLNEVCDCAVPTAQLLSIHVD